MNIAIAQGRRLTIPDGEFVVQAPVDGGLLLISEVSGGSKLLSTKEFERLYAGHHVRIHGAKHRNRYDETGALGPGETLDPISAARAWFCREWDAAPCARSVKALSRFVQSLKAKALRAGITHFPSGGALIRALRERGELGYRPDSVMVDRTGKAPRTSRFDDAIERLIKGAVAYYWSFRQVTKGRAYARLIRAIKLANSLGASRFGNAWLVVRAPSRETFRERINAAENYDAWVAKYGFRQAKLRFKGTARTMDARHVLDQVVIDATVVDGWCVWREANMLPLGRPTLYIATDVRSRMVVARHLGWEPPSLFGVMATIKKILTPKENGVWGKPNEIIVDCAWEHRSPSLIESLKSAGISAHWAPERTPEYKGIGERPFGTINKLVFHRLLGGSVEFPPTEMSRLGLDPSKTANITIEKMDELLEYALDTVYANRVHRGIGEAPRVVWNREIASPAIGRRVVDDLAALLVHFGQVETCTLTREGVTTRDGLRFYNPLAVQHLLSELSHARPHRERQEGSATIAVKVVINQEDLSSVMVWNHVRRIPVILANKHVKFAKECSSLWEYRQIKQYAKEQDAAFTSDEERLLQLHRLQSMIEEVSPTMKAASVRRRRKLMAKWASRGDTVVHAPEEPWREHALEDGDVLTGVPARSNEGDGLPVKGLRRGGKKAEEKRRRTVADRKAAAAAKAAIVQPEPQVQPLLPAVRRAPPQMAPIQDNPDPAVTDINSEIEMAKAMAWVTAGVATKPNGKDE